jgi:hypothetical protein
MPVFLRAFPLKDDSASAPQDTPRCVLSCPRWAVLVRRYSCLSVSSTLSGSALFSNREIQIQVCSPGRLDARRSALLAIGFYLGSDTLRRYTLGDLATSFAGDRHYPRGKRLVLYDAEGDFDRDFDWWKESGKHRVVEPQLPFEKRPQRSAHGPGRSTSWAILIL